MARQAPKHPRPSGPMHQAIPPRSLQPSFEDSGWNIGFGKDQAQILGSGSKLGTQLGKRQGYISMHRNRGSRADGLVEPIERHSSPLTAETGDLL